MQARRDVSKTHSLIIKGYQRIVNTLSDNCIDTILISLYNYLLANYNLLHCTIFMKNGFPWTSLTSILKKHNSLKCRPSPSSQVKSCFFFIASSLFGGGPSLGRRIYNELRHIYNELSQTPWATPHPALFASMLHPKLVTRSPSLWDYIFTRT